MTKEFYTEYYCKKRTTGIDYGTGEIKYIQFRDDIHNFDPEKLFDEMAGQNGRVDMHNCFYCGHRASELTQIRVAIKPPNTPNRWRIIGVACNTCNDKFISQIDPRRNLV